MTVQSINTCCLNRYIVYGFVYTSDLNSSPVGIKNRRPGTVDNLLYIILRASVAVVAAGSDFQCSFLYIERKPSSKCRKTHGLIFRHVINIHRAHNNNYINNGPIRAIIIHICRILLR